MSFILPPSPHCLENLPFLSSWSPVFYPCLSLPLSCCFRRPPRAPQSRGTPSHSAACMCVLSRPPLCVYVGCLPWGLTVLTKAFLSEAIQTLVSLLRRKEARTIRMKMKMTITLMTPTIKWTGASEGRVHGCQPWSGSANHILSSVFQSGDAWKALASAERTSAQCNPPFPD